MSQILNPGDFLIFQLEAGYSLLRLLGVDSDGSDNVWHIASYEDLFFDIDSAETAAKNVASLKKGLAHVALTDRAFESTQVARLANLELTEDDLAPLTSWRNNPERDISDRSIRLLLGLR